MLFNRFDDFDSQIQSDEFEDDDDGFFDDEFDNDYDYDYKEYQNDPWWDE